MVSARKEVRAGRKRTASAWAGRRGEDHPSVAGYVRGYQRVYQNPDINYQGVQYCSSMQAADLLQQRAVTTK